APVRYAPRNPDTACPSGEVTSTLEPYPPAASSPGTGPLTGVGIISAVTTSPETVTGTWKYRRAVTWRASVTVAATVTDQTPAAISSIPATAGSATTNGSRAREAVGTPGTRAASSPASSRVATSHAVTTRWAYSPAAARSPERSTTGSTDTAAAPDRPYASVPIHAPIGPSARHTRTVAPITRVAPSAATCRAGVALAEPPDGG